MLRFEKIKEFKNLRSTSRLIYSEPHGMILSIPGTESGMKVHSFATGKLLFQHRFGPNTVIGVIGKSFKIGRWVFIRYSQHRHTEWGHQSVDVWVAFDFDTLTARELITENKPSGVGLLGRAGSRLVFSCHTGPFVDYDDIYKGKVPWPGEDVMVFDLDDGSFTPLPGMSRLYPYVGSLGATRCFSFKQTRSLSGLHPWVSCAVDGNGLPTMRETGELDHVEADFVRLCGSRRYLFELAAGNDSEKESGMRTLLACDHDMRETGRFPLPPPPDGEITYRYNMPAVFELRQPAAPGILLFAVLHPNAPHSDAPRIFRYLFFDAECRNLLWRHDAVADSGFGIYPSHLMDGFIVRPRAAGAELINTVTGEAADIRTGERVPRFHPANGWWFGTHPGVEFSLYDDPPSHVFWQEFQGAPLCCGVVADSAAAPSAAPPARPEPAPPRKRGRAEPELPVVSGRSEGTHVLCSEAAGLSPRLKAFGEWAPFFRKAGVNLHGYVYTPEGPGLFSDADLREMGYTRGQIECVRLESTDDWHDPAALAADLRRCVELVPDRPRGSRSRKWILRELEHLIGLCESNAGRKLQILSLPSDCREEEDWFGEGVDDEDDEDDEDEDRG